MSNDTTATARRNPQASGTDWIANAAFLHPGSDGGLALAALTSGKPGSVEIPGVDECPAFFAEHVEQSERGVAVDPAPYQVRPETKGTDFDV